MKRLFCGVAAGGDDHRVGEVGPQVVGEPAQVGGVLAVGGGGQLDLDGEQAPVLLDDQVYLVAWSSIRPNSSTIRC